MHLVITRAGLAFDVTWPEPMAIDIVDIAHALAQIVVTPGRMIRPMTVAEAALWAVEIVQREHQADEATALATLLLPAHRAYLPMLDDEHRSMWSTKAVGAFVLLRQHILRRFQVMTAASAQRTLIESAHASVRRAIGEQLYPHDTALLQRFDPAATVPEWLDLADDPIAGRWPNTEAVADAYLTTFHGLVEARDHLSELMTSARPEQMDHYLAREVAHG